MLKKLISISTSTTLFLIFTALINVNSGWENPQSEDFAGDNDKEGDLCSLKDEPHKYCSTMAPLDGIAVPQTSTSPWKIYTWKPQIQQYFVHPVTLGSDKSEEIFTNYILAAKSVENGQILGHFEYQWDAIAECCYFKDKDYSKEGEKLHPNLLHASHQQRLLKPNQTVLWTAPKYFEGEIQFVATFEISGEKYWGNVTSSKIEVIKRNHTRYPFSPGLEDPGSKIAVVAEVTEDSIIDE